MNQATLSNRLSDLLTCGGLTTTPVCSSRSIQSHCSHQQFHWCSFFGSDEDDRDDGPAAARVLARAGNEVFGMGAGGRTPLVEESIRRLLRFECTRDAVRLFNCNDKGKASNPRFSSLIRSLPFVSLFAVFQIPKSKRGSLFLANRNPGSTWPRVKETV